MITDNDINKICYMLEELEGAETKGWNDAIREAIAILENDLDNWPWGRPPIEILRKLIKE